MLQPHREVDRFTKPLGDVIIAGAPPNTSASEGDVYMYNTVKEPSEMS